MPPNLHDPRGARLTLRSIAINCRYEVNEAESMMRREGVSWSSSTHKSIEEIATTILSDLRPDRLVY